MEEREKKVMAMLMSKAYGWKLTKFQYLFLIQLAFRRYEFPEEVIEKSANEVMKNMPELCTKTEGLKHKKNVVVTSSTKSLEQLEAELCNSETIPEKLLQGDVISNVLDFLLKDF